MKTIKIIDLFVKIANGEEVPKKIKYKGVIRVYNNEDKDYISYKADEELYLFYDVLKSGTGDEFVKELNCKVEIIEEDKEIEEALDIILLGQCDNWLQKRDVNIKSDFELNPYILEAITDNFKSLYHKQCELVKAVNELKKGK